MVNYELLVDSMLDIEVVIDFHRIQEQSKIIFEYTPETIIFKLTCLVPGTVKRIRWVNTELNTDAIVLSPRRIN